MAKTSLPTVTSQIPRDLRTYLERVRETLESVQAAQASLEVTVNGGGGGGGGDDGGGDDGGGGGGGGGTLPCGNPVTPSAPTGLVVTAAVSGFLLTWDYPNYCGHARTLVYGARSDNLGGVIELGSSTGSMFSHIVGESNAYWCFWIAHQNILGTVGPLNQTGGSCARTQLDIDYVLELLTGQITASHLYTSLGERIDLIDGDVTLPDSVNARLAAQWQDTVQIVSQVSVGSSGFDSYLIYYFDITAEGWTSANNATLSVANGVLTVTGTGDDPVAQSPVFSTPVSGSAYNLVRLRAMRTAGTGWDGTLTYITTDDDTYTLAVATEPANIDTGYVEVDWDLSGEANWTGNSIKQIKVQLGDGNGDTFNIDWAGVGRNAPGASYESVHAVRVLADNKNRVFYQDAEPTSTSTYTLKANDLWFDTNDGLKPYRWNGSTWLAATDDRLAEAWTEIYDIQTANASPSGAAAQRINGISATAADALSTAQTKASISDVNTAFAGTAGSLAQRLSNTEASVTARNRVFIQSADPSLTNDLATGDLWYDTTNANAVVLKSWSDITSSWTVRRTEAKTYYQDSAPTENLAVGDLWIDTDDDNHPWRYDGSEWDSVRDGYIEEYTSARIVELESAQLGYCVLSGRVTDHASKTACEAAGGTWATGIPRASSIKQISASLSSGANLLPDATFRTVLDDAGVIRPTGVWKYSAYTPGNTAFVVSHPGEAYALKASAGERVLQLSCFGAVAANDTAEVYVDDLPVEAGKRYQLSVYALAGYGKASAFAYWLGTNGAVLEGVSLPYVELVNQSATGTALADYHRLYAFETAPTNAVRARFVLRLSKAAGIVPPDTQYTTARFARPLFGPADAEQVDPTAWIPGLEADLTAAIQIEAETRATTDGGLLSQYTVKIDSAGHVAGYGLASETTSDGATTSAFGVRADKFWVAPPVAYTGKTTPTTGLYIGYVWVDTNTTPATTRYWNGSAWTTDAPNLPFVIKNAPWLGDDGTTQYSAGVYMNDAYVANLNATNITAGTLAAKRVTAFNVTAASLIAGNIVVTDAGGGRTGRIYSDGFTSGLQGWRIDYAGKAEFNDVTARGTVWATNGKFSGWILGGSATESATGTGLYAGYGTTPSYTYPYTPTDSIYRFRVGDPSGARIGWSGTAVALTNPDNQVVLQMGGGENFIKLGSAGYSPDRFVLSGASQRLTVTDGTRDRVVMGRHSDGSYGLSLFDANGNTILTSGGTLSNIGWGGNLVTNSDLPVTLSPWIIGYVSNGGTNYILERDRGGVNYVAAGTHNVGLYRQGPTANSYVIVRNDDKIAVVPGQRYELSAYVAAHRCDVVVWIAFYNAAGTNLYEPSIAYPGRSAGGTSLSAWSRSGTFVTAPTGAAYCLVGLLGDPIDSGQTNCTFWGTRFYFGAAGSGQTAFSDWSAAQPGGLSSLGFPFTADTIGTYISAAAIDTAYIKDAAIKTAKIDDLQITQGKIADYSITFGASLYGSTPRSISLSTVLLETLTLSNLQFNTHMLIFVAAYNNSIGFELQVGLGIDDDPSPRAWSFTLPISGRAYASLCGVHNFGTGTHTIKVYARIPPTSDYDFGFVRPSSQTVYGNIFCIGRYK